MNSDDKPIDVSFVFPCLNEEKTLARCIRAVTQTLSEAPNLSFEIVVADNGSTDASREIAAAAGARIVPVSRRGYGAALLGGFAAARGHHIIFADADATYLYEDALRLYKTAVEADADMAVASRIAGNIEPGAMPSLHRYLGTPVLTGLINRLFHGSLSDCNSGFRCFRKAAFDTWNIRSTGMEFASELLIKALKKKARIVEIPSGLRKNQGRRIPHLKTWRDGMRHLLFILSEKPQLFEIAGLLLAGVASLLQLVSMVVGQVDLGVVSIFGIHTQVLLLLFAMLGTQLFHFGAMCYVNGDDTPRGITAAIINMDEGRLFFLLATMFLLVFLITAGSITLWGAAGFRNIHFANILIGLVHFIAMPVSVALGLLGVHVIKRYR